VNPNPPQSIDEYEAPESLSVARLEQLRANYEAAKRAGQWHKPIFTTEQRQVAAQLLAELALLDEQERIPESEG
jgi:peptidyl-tRNA hydrolase